MTQTVIFLLLMIPGTFFLGLNDILVRKILKGSSAGGQALLSYDFASVGILGGIILLFSGIPEIKPGFWSAILITTALNIFGQWSWYAAFKKEEASLIAPLRLITPPLILITGFLFLKEEPSLMGAFGVLVTFIGLWFLLQGEAIWKGKKFFEIIRRPGVLLGIWGAISFAISFPFDKKAVITSSALLAFSLSFLGVGVGNALISMIFRGGRRDLGALNFKQNLKFFLVLPFVHTLAVFLNFEALKYSLAAYAGSVKRLWSLWTVILSGRFLKEGNISRKLIATIIMLLGIAVTVALG